MKKKITYFIMLIAITMFQFGPLLTIVNAEVVPPSGIFQQTKINNVGVVNLYVGKITQNGLTELKYLYTDAAVTSQNTLDEISSILPDDYKALLPATPSGQIASSSNNQVNVNEFFTDAGTVAANMFPNGTTQDTSTTLIYDKDAYDNLVGSTKGEIASRNAQESGNRSSYNTLKEQYESANPGQTYRAYVPKYIDGNNWTNLGDGFYSTTDVQANNNIHYRENGAQLEQVSSHLENINESIREVNYMEVNGVLVKVHNTSANVVTMSDNLVHKTTGTTIYHTKVTGALNITGTDTFNKEYSSGDNYMDGNYNEGDPLDKINEFKNDITANANNLRSSLTIAEGITNYYFIVHDEYEYHATCPAEYLGEYPEYEGEDCTVITTVLDKYQTYRINASGETKNIKEINVTLEGPFVNDEVTLEPFQGVCLNPSGCYTPSRLPDVSTNTPHVKVSGVWVEDVTNTLGNLNVNLFSGTFQRDGNYRALITAEGLDGYTIDNDAIIRINGQDPETAFGTSDGNKYSNFIGNVESQVRRVKYTLTAEDGNQISFIEDEGIVFTFNSMDILGLTDEDLEALAEEAGMTFDEIKAYGNEIINNVKVAVKGKGNLLKIFQLQVTDGNADIHQVEGGFKIRIKITDDIKGYDVYSLVYVDDNFGTEDPIYLTVNGDYLEGVLPHLSAYTLMGDNNPVQNKIANPNTGDNIMFYVSLLGISTIGLLGAGLYLRKRKYN